MLRDHLEKRDLTQTSRTQQAQSGVHGRGYGILISRFWPSSSRCRSFRGRGGLGALHCLSCFRVTLVQDSCVSEVIVELLFVLLPFLLELRESVLMRLEEGLRPVLVAEGKALIPLTMGSGLQQDYPGEV